MKTLATIFGALALMTWGTVAQEGPVPATAADAQPALAAPAAIPAVEVQPAAEIQPAAPAAEAVQAEQTASAEPKTAPLSMVEVILFCVVVVGVIALGIWKSRDPEETEEEKKAKGASDYFLAGRGLTWWLVGFSLIAANISTEQFVGMSGKSANWVGMAIAGYEWLAAITLVVVAFCFLPKLLKGGVYTIPEFLEYRYNTLARSLMAIATLLILVGVPTAGVIYAGAKVISVFFTGYSAMGIDFGNITVGCVIILRHGIRVRGRVESLRLDGPVLGRRPDCGRRRGGLFCPDGAQRRRPEPFDSIRRRQFRRDGRLPGESFGQPLAWGDALF